MQKLFISKRGLVYAHQGCIDLINTAKTVILWNIMAI